MSLTIGQSQSVTTQVINPASSSPAAATASSIYIGADPQFSHQAGQVISCFKTSIPEKCN